MGLWEQCTHLGSLQSDQCSGSVMAVAKLRPCLINASQNIAVYWQIKIFGVLCALKSSEGKQLPSTGKSLLWFEHV